MTETIASVVTQCLDLFRGIFQSQELADVLLEPMLLRRLSDEQTRFIVWAGNIGAHQVGMSSLDYRLRDSSHIRNQIIRLLQDLSSLLEDTSAILVGDKLPWDELSDDQGSDAEGETKSDDDSFDIELNQISVDITEVVDCLLRMSMTIRNPSRHDRFVGSKFTETLFFEPFDIQHVYSKFGSTDSEIANRLGRAITRRRQYFKYREAHHAKLSHGLRGDSNFDALTETMASSISERLKDQPRTDKNTPVDIGDNYSEAEGSQTSYATSTTNDQQLHIPPLPETAYRGPFECPFCFMIIIASNRDEWKRHVYGDLRPYICLEKDCKTPQREYIRQRDWIQHVKSNHWKIYKCPFACDTTYTSALDYKNHVLQFHSSIVSPAEVETVVELGAQPLDSQSGRSCPLCFETIGSVRQYQRHVGRHQEQLALFALPNLNPENESNSDQEETDSLQSIETGSDKSYGNEGNPKPDEQEETLGRGARERTRVIYNDGLTEEQWLSAVDDDDNSPEAAAARKQARKGSANESSGPNIKGGRVRFVSPQRDENKIRGILKNPTPKFPEESIFYREGVAPHKDDQTKKDVPPGARWTKISRKRVNPEALTIRKERFEVRGDHVIVLRVLSREEIEAYATATAEIRGKCL
ncbi:hypothetical protein GGR58DRAFT_488844 [Xylaria digitata]|nr:hypothetical protein GGR58DRAFT_488844 [Xylaria digitata]